MGHAEGGFQNLESFHFSMIPDSDAWIIDISHKDQNGYLYTVKKQKIFTNKNYILFLIQFKFKHMNFLHVLISIN